MCIVSAIMNKFLYDTEHNTFSIVLSSYHNHEYYYVLSDLCEYLQIKGNNCLCIFEHLIVGYLQNKIPVNIQRYILNLNCYNCELGDKLCKYSHNDKIWDYSLLEYLILRHPYVLKYIHIKKFTNNYYFVLSDFIVDKTNHNKLYNSAFKEILTDLDDCLKINIIDGSK